MRPLYHRDHAQRMGDGLPRRRRRARAAVRERLRRERVPRPLRRQVRRQVLKFFLLGLRVSRRMPTASAADPCRCGGPVFF